MAYILSQSTEEITLSDVTVDYKIGDIVTVQEHYIDSFITLAGMIISLEWNSLCGEFFYDIYVGHCPHTKKQAYVCTPAKWINKE